MNKEDLKIGHFYFMEYASIHTNDEPHGTLYVTAYVDDEKKKMGLFILNDRFEAIGETARVDLLQQFNWDLLVEFGPSGKVFKHLEDLAYKKYKNE